MGRYYFLSCMLPKLELGVQPDIVFDEIKNIMDCNLSKRDWEVFFRFRQYLDVKNLKAKWLKRDIDRRGNLDEKELDEVLLVADGFPELVFDYLGRYKSDEERVRNYPKLLFSFLNYNIEEEGNPFLRFFFKMELDMAAVLTALRSREEKRDLASELEFAKDGGWLIDHLLSQKDSKELDLPYELEDLKGIFFKNRDNPKRLNFELLNYRFKRIEYFCEKIPFTISSILGYAVNLMTVEDYSQLDKTRGDELLGEVL